MESGFGSAKVSGLPVKEYENTHFLRRSTMNKKLLVLAAGLALIAAVVLFAKKRGAAGK